MGQNFVWFDPRKFGTTKWLSQGLSYGLVYCLMGLIGVHNPAAAVWARSEAFRTLENFGTFSEKFSFSPPKNSTFRKLILVGVGERFEIRRQ